MEIKFKAENKQAVADYFAYRTYASPDEIAIINPEKIYSPAEAKKILPYAILKEPITGNDLIKIHNGEDIDQEWEVEDNILNLKPEDVTENE